MPTTKYIINSLPEQIITGDLKINGNLTVASNNGTLTEGTYRALMTHVESITSSNFYDFDYALIIGETYTITDYASGDDFSNVADVISGTINTSGCTFIATGETPANWLNGSTLQSSGNLVVQVLENTLGYDIKWEWFNFIEQGLYVGFRDYGNNAGGYFNDFARTLTSATITQSSLIGAGGLLLSPPGPISQFAGPASWSAKDDSLAVYNFNYDSYSSQAYWLRYTPIEIRVKQNLDTTPITINGTVSTSFPFSYASFDFVDNTWNVTDSVYTDDGTTVYDIPELVSLLNSNPNTSYFGTYADDGNGGLTLTMPMHLKKQFSPLLSGVLSFSVFSD